MPSPKEILTELKKVKYPGFTRDIVSFGYDQRYRGRTFRRDRNAFRARRPSPKSCGRIVEEIRKTVATMPGVADVKVEVEQPAPAQPRTGSCRRKARFPA